MAAKAWMPFSVVVPAEMTVRMPVERRIEGGLTDYLLDYNQELAVKSDLDLPDDSQHSMIW